ncbi:purine nucleosidase [Herbihabitans rhizosphaerae]|uniref:Purine nucleosidase n=1 Tax=Herbihabitans rhizosphaerae TaxID=1872711 RepID=A0A4Q7L6N0_9PSEU|nr:purine nucleosidase [Herbihabitans rhizosphaerae]
MVHTDPGVDDAFALIYLALHGGVTIEAVGSVHGNLGARGAAENALRILELVGMEDIPVAVGADLPLNREPPVYSGQIVHGTDGLGGNAGPAARTAPIRESAAEQLVQMVRKFPGELTVLELGPLTNLALALHLEPDLPSLVRDVVWLGGTIERFGNITPDAEANTHHDPEAAEIVLAAGLPLTVVPLDATRGAWADDAFLTALEESPNPLAHKVNSWLGQYVETYTKLSSKRGCELFDLLAASVLTDPGVVRLAEPHEVTVELLGHGRGRTMIDRRPLPFAHTLPGREPVTVIREIDAEPVMRRMLDMLTAPMSET